MKDKIKWMLTIFAGALILVGCQDSLPTSSEGDAPKYSMEQDLEEPAQQNDAEASAIPAHVLDELQSGASKTGTSLNLEEAKPPAGVREAQ